MDAKRHARIKRLFLEACELAPTGRAAFLEHACGDDGELRREVELLLHFHIEDDAVELGQRRTAAPVAQTPARIGPYRVVRRLGEGGMGMVYEVEQEEPIRRRLALKVVKWGMDTAETLARFESERQVLALMNHPNIASVYEAGATPEGRPYFAMEYVEGEWISAFCDRNRLGMRERVDLFLQVCDGVQHAHQRGIIHRDLKPSNVLVTVVNGRPVPKIIDFGVAKATRRLLSEKEMFTESGVMVGTPEYMSPEQAELGGLDIDIRTDIYSLGVILYDLLVGVLPFDAKQLREAGFDEIRRVIRECEPPRPSTRVTTLGDASTEAARNRATEPAGLRRQLRGDLDWITMKALEKERTRRYVSIADFAADLRRHLHNEPVLASPPSTFYRVGKFVRRHRVGVSATSIVVIALATGLTLSATGLVRARREAETARRVSEFLVSMFVDMNPAFMTTPVRSTEELLARAVDRIDVELDGQPAVQAQMLTTVGETYADRGDYEQAKLLLERAVAIRREHLGPEHVDSARSVSQLADLLWSTGAYEEARRLHEEALEVRQRLLGPDHLEVAWSYRSLGATEWRLGDFDRARTLLGQAVDLGERTQGPDHPDVASSLVLLAALETDNGEFEAARLRLERALDILERRLGTDHTRVGDARFMLGLVHLQTGDLDAARANMERARAIQENVLGGDHAAVAFPLNELAVVLIRQGDLEGARPLLDRALAIRESARGTDHLEVSWTLNAFGYLYRRLGEFDKARESYKQALAIQEKVLGPSHFEVARTLYYLAHLEAASGRYPEARPLLERQIEILRGVFPAGHSRLASPLYALGCVLAVGGDGDMALESLREAVDSGFAGSVWLTDRDLDSLRGDPEFETLQAELARRAAQQP